MSKKSKNFTENFKLEFVLSYETKSKSKVCLGLKNSHNSSNLEKQCRLFSADLFLGFISAVENSIE